VRVSGLSESRSYRACLPAGVGPRAELAERLLNPGSWGGEIVVKISGDWEYRRIEAQMPFPGSSVHLERVEDPSGATPSVWGVSPWLGPGRGATAPFYLMMPAAGPRPSKLRLHFKSFEPIEVDPGAEAQVRFVLRKGAGDSNKEHAAGGCGSKAMAWK
jgi:hypothetical protein